MCISYLCNEINTVSILQTPKVTGFRTMTQADVPAAFRLVSEVCAVDCVSLYLTVCILVTYFVVTAQVLAIFVVVLCWQYLSKFNLSPVFTEEEFCHWFLPSQGIVDSYIVEVNCFVQMSTVYSILTDSWFSYACVID